MKFIKKILNKIKSLFKKRPPSVKKIVSEEKAVLECAIKEEEILARIQDSKSEIEKMELSKQIVRQELAKEILEFVDSEILLFNTDKKSKNKLFELHELRVELRKLKEKKAELIIYKSNIKAVELPDLSSLDRKVKKLFNYLSKNKYDEKVALSEIPYINVENSYQKYEKVINEKSLLSRYKSREQERKKQRQLYEGNIKRELNNLDLLINQNKLSEAKSMAKRISKILKPDYRKGDERLTRSLERIREKELLLFKRQQDEAFQRHREETVRIKIQEELIKQEKRLEILNRGIDFVLDSEKEDILNDYRIDYVFHMTEISNLSNILKYGLLSHNEAHAKGLNKTNIALQDVNERRAEKKPIHGISLHDYVPMYFNPKNPMLYRRKQIQDNIVIVAIDRRVVYHEKSIFSDGNAASDSTLFFNDISYLNRLNWQCIRNDYWNNYVDGKRMKCAESLARPKIPIKYVKKIHCNSIQTKNIVDKIVGYDKSFRIELNSKYFFSR